MMKEDSPNRTKDKKSRDGMFPKHKLKIPYLSNSGVLRDHPELVITQMHSIKSKTLQKLAVLELVYFHLPSSEMQVVKKRIHDMGKTADESNIASEITLKEIQQLLKVKERSAREYKSILQVIHS